MRHSFSIIRYPFLHYRSRFRARSRPLQNDMSIKPLDPQVGPLVWIDCEMTGLNPRKDKLLEIAVLITNGDLQVVDDGIQYVIKTKKEDLDGMDEWCVKQHGKSGLTRACLDSPYTHEYVASQVLAYIKQWVPQSKTGILAGSSVHYDRVFLAESMPEIVEWLHYRIIDVSSVKELSRRWFPQLPFPRPTDISHRALDDIRGSIRELQWYRDNVFISTEQADNKAKRS